VTAPALTIAQLSARSGAAPSALRYYEELGLIRAERTAGNQRRYPRHMLRRVAFIRAGRQLGLSLRRCALYNPADAAARLGAGARWLLGDELPSEPR
jgi:MerR family redox-sensitive transcriptional activator SoxR